MQLADGKEAPICSWETDPGNLKHAAANERFIEVCSYAGYVQSHAWFLLSLWRSMDLQAKGVLGNALSFLF